MNNNSISAAKPENAERLTEIALAAKAFWGYDQTFMTACVDELSVTKAMLTNQKFIYNLAMSKDEIIGFYGLEKLSTSLFELDALFVWPDFIGKGVGKILMTHAKQTAQSMGCDKLTIQSDPNAEAFYHATGAKTVGQKASCSVQGRYLPLLEITF